MIKLLVLLGSNSKLAVSLIDNGSLYESFDSIYLLSGDGTRHSNWLKAKQTPITKLKLGSYSDLETIIEQHKFDATTFLFCGTASNKELYDSAFVVKKSIKAVYSQIVAIGENKQNRYFVVGSSLALIPLLNRSPYKDLKQLELQLFDSFLKFHPNTYYIVAPPLQPFHSIFAKLIGMKRPQFSRRIIELLEGKNPPNNYVIVGGYLYKVLAFCCLILFLVLRSLR